MQLFLLTGIVAFIYFLVVLNPAAKDGLLTYINNRVLYSISAVSTVNNRFELLWRLAQELVLPIALSLLIFFLLKRKFSTQKIYSGHFAFFLLIGISASFPLIITLEQRGFYLVTSLPFYSLAFAMIPAPHLAAAIEKINPQKFPFKIFKLLSMSFLIGAIIFSGLQVGKFSRDEEILRDVYLIGKTIPEKTNIGSMPELWAKWALQEYFVRHYYICMSAEITRNYDDILIDDPKKIPTEIPVEKINIPTKGYYLYKVIK